MRKLARETGRPVWFLLTDRYEDPQRWRRLMKAVHTARAEGLPLTAQIAGRPIGVMMGIGTALNPFTVRPSYKALESLPIAEQRKQLRDGELRRKILAEKPSEAEVAKLSQFRQLVTSRWDKFFTMDDPPDYEPDSDKSVAAIAARSSCRSLKGSGLPRTSDSARRIVQSVRASPGGSTAFSENCTLPSRLT